MAPTKSVLDYVAPNEAAGSGNSYLHPFRLTRSGAETNRKPQKEKLKGGLILMAYSLGLTLLKS